ncbi:N-acetylmuramoyl-L-alanine amidase [Synoicihabitans lomoniglobus]|uniref:N-acetylmuramoyl-L-alanine amidase n=1 Tax=Synoicihabitans lomoniglobus TaxID=2909285 RepID=A0AAF0CRY6_9BACT|nr:N-acetylmuramoyl-L-alanine amidase [Opitutaceae bacterium LMO-M01]WED66941.1 N-acetylmuramoyl-L-alanine amidase [Opitutaceae bacterium LMO-M01]
MSHLFESGWRRSASWLTLSVGLLAGCATPAVAPEAEGPDPVTVAAVEEPLVDAESIAVEPIAVEPEIVTPSPEAEIPAGVAPGTLVTRHGDEIMVAGQLFRTGTPVVLWVDEGGYDGYRVERRFSSASRADWTSSVEDNPALESPNRYGMRGAVLTATERERVRGGGWDLATLQRVVDQFVLHYDVSGTSARCFERLHDQRGLSIHFMLDVDGTIYQTIDLKERAWHATFANSRSIGIEIANIGAYPPARANPLEEWYARDETGRTALTIPKAAYPESVRAAEFSGRPIRDDLQCGSINGDEFYQYDFTHEQYAALIKLTATLCTVFPNLACDYPRDAEGQLRTDTLSREEWKAFQGVLGHFHLQTNKVDPGPAMQWDRVIGGARALLPEAAID